MSVERVQSRRGVLLSMKEALRAELAGELAQQVTANANDTQRLYDGALPLQGVIPADALVAPQTLQIAPQGALVFDEHEEPAIRIAALSGIQTSDSGIDRFGLYTWPVAVYVYLGHIGVDANYPTYTTEERLVLALECYMDAIRIAIDKDGTGVACGFYGVYGFEYVNQRVTYHNIRRGDHVALELLGEQIWNCRQGVRTGG